MLYQPLAAGVAGLRVPAIVGAVLSILIVTVLVASMLPALSSAKKLTVVVPSAVIFGRVAMEPATGVIPMVVAPLALYVILLAPDPPVSVALRTTVTF